MILSWYSQGDVDGAGTCLLTQLSRTAPTMAFSSGYSYSCGGTVFFTGQAHVMSNDNRLAHGAEGKITGPENGADKDERACGVMCYVPREQGQHQLPLPHAQPNGALRTDPPLPL